MATITGRRIAGSAAALILVGAFAVAGVTWQPLRHQIALSVTRQPEPHSDLYFTDYAALRRRINSPGPQPVPITIVNHERGAVDYQLQITLTVYHPGNPVPENRQLEQATIRVGEGGTAVHTYEFAPADRADPYVFTATIGNGQAIHFSNP